MSKSQVVQLEVDGRLFRFPIYDKIEHLGDVAVHQLWMNISKLYKRPLAHDLAEGFWALCLQAQGQGEAEHPHDRQTYLLARLLPVSLTSLAAKVMPDRSLGLQSKSRVRDAAKWATDLIDKFILQADSGKDVPDIVKFRDQSYDLLEMPVVSHASGELYEIISRSLFDDAADLMRTDREAAVRLVKQRWAEAKKKYYRQRRWKNPEAERVMCDLSYECRASMHECYSDVWKAMLSATGPLRSIYALTPADLSFLGLWNTVLTAPGGHPDERFDLFHGHIFALHPAMRLLIRAEHGKLRLAKLVSDLQTLAPMPNTGDLLETMRRLPSFLRFLQAIVLALYTYVDQREELASANKIDRLRPMSQKRLEAAVVRRMDLRLGTARRANRHINPEGGTDDVRG